MGDTVMANENVITPEPIKIYLDVEHVWQLDPEHNLPENEKPRICALACMKMIVDYLSPEKAKNISLEGIFSDMSGVDGRNSIGDWQHKDQVKWLKSQGLIAWRRNWLAPSQDPSYFVENEGYSNNQLVAVSEQIIAELGLKKAKRTDQIRYSLVNSLLAGLPVIISVRDKELPGSQNHQIVLCGYDQAQNTWKFVDPMLEEGSVEYSDEYFMKYFNKRAIFVSKI